MSAAPCAEGAKWPLWAVAACSSWCSYRCRGPPGHPPRCKLPTMHHAPTSSLLLQPCCRGFADSKTLSEEKRDRLFAVIQEQAGVLGSEADVLSAALISGGWVWVVYVCRVVGRGQCRRLLHPFLGSALPDLLLAPTPPHNPPTPTHANSGQARCWRGTACL